MPTKLFDGLTELFQVSIDTAIPVIPENPSPPPLTPKAVGLVTLASASVKVSPSAPEPEPIKASKAAVMPAPGTGVGQNADPANQLVAGVNCRLGGVALLFSTDEPFNCQPPDVGEGMLLGAGPAV